MNIQISNSTVITGGQASTFAKIRPRLTFPNPAWLENEKRGYLNWDTYRQFRCYDSIPCGVSFPRGFTGQAIRIAKQNGEQIHIEDRRRAFPDVDFIFTENLKPFQQAAVSDVILKPFGTLQAPTGSGKTVMALSAIAARRQPAIVVVHTKELLNQWID